VEEGGARWRESVFGRKPQYKPVEMQDTSRRELAAGQTGGETPAFIISQAPLMFV
jgi:hypothetical protein